MRIDDLAPEGQRREKLVRRLLPLLTSMEMRAGMSDHVSSLLEAKAYFLQASIALENGSLIDPAAPPLYRFQDYALTEMVVNSVGKLPLEMFYTRGLRALLVHDSESGISYTKTLACFLAHNMNVTRTARALYIHRSTLIERLDRIRELLGEDLANPDVRLRLELIFKAMELHDQLQKRFEEHTESVGAQDMVEQYRR
ncbi:CdaR family transcriptional regulator [Olsenella sp. Marseille-P4559]|uniref:PucR family transcriptional regulator n=1 Tax=Olsenella sp. Marseille-P4559 TaxID=2364795 RepID=UPI0013EF56EA|nr:helix-turn-helix domain-containing protein [Olsenella sp. Marseille-P4559]